jgi:hypothetical protein
MSGTLGNTKKKEPIMSEANMKRAERFNLGNHGPPMSAEEQLEAKKRKLESLAKNLEIQFGFDEVRVVPSLNLLKPVTLQDFAELPKKNRDLKAVPIPIVERRTPAEVGDETVYKHITRTYTDRGLAPNFAAVSDHFGLTKMAPQRMFDRHSKSIENAGKENILPVRASILDEKRVAELIAETRQYEGAVQKQKSKDKWIEKIDELRLKQLQETQPNSCIDDVKKLDVRTYEKILDAVVPDEKITTKQLGQGRIDAQTIPHNAITCCALVEATFNNTAKECIFSSDMFTLYIDPTSAKAELVRCPAGTLAALREQKLTPGFEERGDKLHLGKCALPTFATFDPNGDVLCIFLLFIDKNVPHPDDGKYEIYPMETDGGHRNPIRNATLFAAVIPYEFDEEKFMHQLWTHVIIPKTETRCLDLMRMHLQGKLQKIRTPTPSPALSIQESESANLANTSSRSLPDVPGHVPRAPMSDLNEELRSKMLQDPSWCSHYRNPVHCMDGDNPNINAIMSSEKMAKYGLKSISELCAAKRLIKMRFLKWAAGCSYLESPNDVASCHRDVKKQTGAGSAMQTVSVDMKELAGPVAKFIQDVMVQGAGKGIDAARKKSMIAYAARAKAIFSRSFNVGCLQEGWAACGYFPRNYRRIMSKWSGWTQLTPTQGKQILDAIPVLAAKSSENNAGRLDDSFINSKFSFLMTPPLNVADFGIPRDRVCQINATGYLPSRDEHGAARVEKEAAKAAKAQADAAKIPTDYTPYGPGCNMWKKQAVIVQLELRRQRDPSFSFKPSSQVAVLCDLWKNFDARSQAGGGAM